MWRATVLALLLCCTIGAWAQDASMDTLHWNGARALKAADFKMAPMEFTGMEGEAVCLLLADYEQKSPTTKPRYNVRASFDRGKSWLQQEGSHEAILRFFQVMFDIYELHARTLKKDLIEGSPVTGIDAYLKERYAAGLGAAMDEFNQFRRESQMGKVQEVVKNWSERVRRDIAALEPYAADGNETRR